MKVKFGLKNVYYAKATIAADGSATYGEPVRWPGAVNLSLDAQGDVNRFRADNIDYYVSQSNNGYEGDFESALVPDSFRKDILGEFEDTNGLQVEEVDADMHPFALLFQFEDDVANTRHVMYNCTASRPAVASQTTDTTIEPVTESLTITASSIYVPTLDKDVVKAKVGPDQATPYAAWFTAVQLPA